MELELNSNMLDDGDAARIGTAIQRNTCLKKLDLSENRIVARPTRDHMEVSLPLTTSTQA